MEALQASGTDLNAAHVRNFLDCVKSWNRPNADIEEGHRSAVMCHLGNISTRLGRAVRWDSENESIIGDAQAATWLSHPYRQPWKLA
jgi:hypothetical protein